MKKGIAASKGYAIGKVFLQVNEEIVITDKKVSDMPALLKALQQAEENLLFEQESTAGRGGETISSSMIEE